MPFPLIKLGYLAIKQISKPLANTIKQKAKTTPFLRNYILLPPAQLYHKLDTTIKMRLLGLGKVEEVKPLSDEMAVELAADMLGEGVIFGIAALTLWLEYRRQIRKDQNKEDVQNTRLNQLEEKVKEMISKVDENHSMLNEITKVLQKDGKLKLKLGDGLPHKLRDAKSNTVLEVVKT